MSKAQDERRKMKKTILHELKALKCSNKSTPQEAIESLVKQAQHYTNFLLSRVDGAAKQGDQQAAQTTFTRLTQQPQCLKGGHLKYYQLVALNWMISLYESGISGILADDMGLGKTIQTISMLAFLRQYKQISGPHIIIAPKITLGNWMREISKWLPEANAIKLAATKDERQQGLQIIASRNFDIVVTSYEGVNKGLSTLKKIKWQYLIIDQAHKIKNQESQLSQLIRKLDTECKLLLTGTPLQNNLHQLWSLMNFLIPEVFSSAEPFDNWLSSATEGQNAAEVQKRNAQMIGQLHKILRPFMLRRTKAEVQKTLPGKKQIHVYVGLSEIQLKIYKNLLQNRNASEQQKRHYLNLLMQLRKVCCHPYLFPNVQPTDAPPIGEHLIQSCGKLLILDRLLGKLYKQGDHKVLIFSQMTSVLDILQDYCNLRMYGYCRIDGSTDMKMRDSQIEAFMTTQDHFIFLLSTRAGGLGINLTQADTVIIYDSDFNPQMDLQAMDRAHRIGQKKKVRVYRLITENTVEQKIIERQMIKLKWDSLVIQQQRAANKNKTLTKDQMKQMLQYGANAIFKATNNTLTDQVIDDLLDRGEKKTEQFTLQLQQKIKPPTDLANMNIDSINIFDFMQRDQQKKRNDAEAILLNQIRQQQQANQLRGRRQKIKAPRVKVQKKIVLQEHHFYQNKERLKQLLQKEEDYKNNKGMEDILPLNSTQEKQKNQLLQTGFRDWNKTDFNAFVTASQKWGRNTFSQIAVATNKQIDVITSYANTFWDRIDELTDAERILKQIEGGQGRLENKKQQYQLLQWKKQRCSVIDFNPTTYTKFKSKLFSIEADKFLAESVYKLGSRHMHKVKQLIREESVFRFDHYLRTRSQADLNKRMVSIYRLIEKQRDNDLFGIDNDQTTPKTKRIRPWENQTVQKQQSVKQKKKKK